jgi:hypothetical protein
MDTFLHVIVMTCLAADIGRFGVFLSQVLGVAEYDLAGVFRGEGLILDLKSFSSG